MKTVGVWIGTGLVLGWMGMMGCSSSDEAVTAASEDAATQTSDTTEDIASDLPDGEDEGDIGGDTADPRSRPTIAIASVAPESMGPYGVGRTTLQWTDADRDRTIPVEFWYPAEGDISVANSPVLDFETGERRATLQALLDASPEGCPSTESGAVLDATPRDATGFPLLVFSHCTGCTRWSSFTAAERLASWGFVVISADHETDTVFDTQAGQGAGLTPELVALRAEDIGFMLDVALDAEDERVPDGLRGHFDAQRVGVFGHSLGAVTTGRVLQDDTRPVAGLGLFAPMENILLPGVSMTAIDVPLLLALAGEDNSIQEIGNQILRDNFQSANPPVTLVEFADLGHWSFSDICGLGGQFMPGCGDDERQTDGEPFTYPALSEVRPLGAALVTAFFAAELADDAMAAAWLQALGSRDGVTVQTRQ